MTLKMLMKKVEHLKYQVFYNGKILEVTKPMFNHAGWSRKIFLAQKVSGFSDDENIWEIKDFCGVNSQDLRIMSYLIEYFGIKD